MIMITNILGFQQNWEYGLVKFNSTTTATLQHRLGILSTADNRICIWYVQAFRVSEFGLTL